jgi:hypothetical protein
MECLDKFNNLTQGRGKREGPKLAIQQVDAQRTLSGS